MKENRLKWLSWIPFFVVWVCIQHFFWPTGKFAGLHFEFLAFNLKISLQVNMKGTHFWIQCSEYILHILGYWTLSNSLTCKMTSVCFCCPHVNWPVSKSLLSNSKVLPFTLLFTFKVMQDVLYYHQCESQITCLTVMCACSGIVQWMQTPSFDPWCH